jgi:hypothetical protein
VPKIVGIHPPSALTSRARLFSALSATLGVRFEGRREGAWEGIDAAIIVGGFPADAPRVPVLHYIQSETPVKPSSRRSFVDLAADPAVDERLRGRRLTEASLAASPERLTHGRALAHDEHGTVWARDDTLSVQACVVAPSELATDEPLRNRFRAGRFLALLPLIQLIRRVSDYETWSKPSIRAAFLFDDPNLHRPSYGHIRFAELAAHARLHHYHVAFGTIPLDCWYADPRAVGTFMSARCSLSLAVHGNDHLFQEFALPRSPSLAVAVVAQALERIRRFEDKTGLPVDRVMVPPHGLCSEEMLDAMLCVGVEALCRARAWWSEWPGARVRTADWHMADIAPSSGGPIIGRLRFLDPSLRDEALLTLFLDQPLVLYGHHYDVSSGYDVLAKTAEWLHGLGRVTWHSLGGLARTNFESRIQPNGVLRIRSYSRSFSVAVPENVERVLVEVPSHDAISLDRFVTRDGEFELSVANGVALAEIPVAPGQHLGLRLERTPEVSPALLRTVTYRALTRRAVAETRDRLQPLAQRAGVNPLLSRLEAAYNRSMNARMRARTRDSD